MPLRSSSCINNEEGSANFDSSSGQGFSKLLGISSLKAWTIWFLIRCWVDLAIAWWGSVCWAVFKTDWSFPWFVTVGSSSARLISADSMSLSSSAPYSLVENLTEPDTSWISESESSCCSASPLAAAASSCSYDCECVCSGASSAIPAFLLYFMKFFLLCDGSSRVSSFDTTMED